MRFQKRFLKKSSTFTMTAEARTRIDAHRLMRVDDDPQHEERIRAVRNSLNERKIANKERWKKRALIHTGVFAISFVFALGVTVLGILFIVRPDVPLTQLFISFVFGAVFVATFAALRMLVLHHFLDDSFEREDDPGVTHHITKSIAYGFVALVFAVLLVGLIINVASAGIL